MSNFRFLSVLSISLALLTLLTEIGFTQTIPETWRLGTYQPPESLGSPDVRDTGGTRGITKLQAITPQEQFGVTTLAYPTFFIYVGNIDPSANYHAGFILENNSTLEEIFKVEFTIKASQEIISISLPQQAGIRALELDQNYRWSFSLEHPQNFNDYQRTEGFIKRVLPSTGLMSQLETNTDSYTQAKIYAEQEIWYDAVTLLAQAYREEQQDINVVVDWQRLLQSAGLDFEIQQAKLFSYLPTSFAPLLPRSQMLN